MIRISAKYFNKPIIGRGLAGLALLATVALSSCIKVPDAVDVPIRNSSALTGHVTLLDQYQIDSLMGPVVTVTAAGVGAEVSSQADGSGNYALDNLKPGKYDLTISAPGFITITYPGYEHIGGSTQVAPRYYLYQPSTTLITSLEAINQEKVVRSPFKNPITLPQGSTFAVLGTDTLFFSYKYLFRNKFRDTLVRKTFTADSSYTFTKDTTFFKNVVTITKTKFVKIKVVIDSISLARRTRGTLLFFSDNQASTTSYRVQRQFIIAPGSVADSLVLPLEFFADAGILRLPSTAPNANQFLNITAYGASGTKNWYGASFNREVGKRTFPGINPVAGPAVTLVLPDSI